MSSRNRKRKPTFKSPNFSHIERIWKPINTRISAYLSSIWFRLSSENVSSCKQLCVKKLTDKLKYEFHSCSSKMPAILSSLRKKSLISVIDSSCKLQSMTWFETSRITIQSEGSNSAS